MVNFTILAGGFSAFIATYLFDSEAATLTLSKRTETGENPSWIASHPTNSSILYAVNEVGPVGSLQSFLVDAEGGLTLVDTVETGGNGPTFTNPLSTGEVTAMNFGSPNCSIVKTDPSNPLLFEKGKGSSIVEFPVGDGPSNPHQSLEFEGEVFVPDLGGDKIWRIGNVDGVFKVHGQIDFEPGNGPRHIAIRDNILFTIHELTSVLTAQTIPAAPNGTVTPLLANVSIVPTDIESLNTTFRAAEIFISEPTETFPDPLIYVSNRNLGPDFDPRGDSIAIFEFKFPATNETVPEETTPPTPAASAAPSVITLRPAKRTHSRDFMRRGETYPDTPETPEIPVVEDDSDVVEPPATEEGSLVLLTHVFTGLKQIRSMAIGPVRDGADEFLVAGGNVEGGVVVYQRVEGGRNLTEVARNVDLPSRTSFVFL